MNCCGSKRNEWLNKGKTIPNQDTIEHSFNSFFADEADTVFEYTGNYSQAIKGVVSGLSYNFKCKGDKLKVDHRDSFAMIAERDLKIVRSELISE